MYYYMLRGLFLLRYGYFLSIFYGYIICFKIIGSWGFIWVKVFWLEKFKFIDVLLVDGERVDFKIGVVKIMVVVFFIE